MIEELRALLLVVVANGTPVLADNLLGKRLACPLDGGRTAPDGRPWLGPSKTFRGVASALVATPVVATLLGLPPSLGLGMGSAAMAGDLLASFVKRRLGIAPSGRAPLLDQLPESLLPVLLYAGPLGLDTVSMGLVVLAFVLLDLALSPLLCRMGLRKRPY